MAEERSFQLLDIVVDPAVNHTPNYLRLVQAYRSYLEERASAHECALRLTEITRPGLRPYNFPHSVAIRTEQAECETGRLNSLVRDMVGALHSGDRASLAQHYQQATQCFQVLSSLAKRASQSSN